MTEYMYKPIQNGYYLALIEGFREWAVIELTDYGAYLCDAFVDPHVCEANVTELIRWCIPIPSPDEAIDELGIPEKEREPTVSPSGSAIYIGRIPPSVKAMLG